MSGKFGRSAPLTCSEQHFDSCDLEVSYRTASPVAPPREWRFLESPIPNSLCDIESACMMLLRCAVLSVISFVCPNLHDSAIPQHRDLTSRLTSSQTADRNLITKTDSTNNCDIR